MTDTASGELLRRALAVPGGRERLEGAARAVIALPDVPALEGAVRAARAGLLDALDAALLSPGSAERWAAADAALIDMVTRTGEIGRLLARRSAAGARVLPMRARGGGA